MKKGFTLIELLIVIIIIGVLATIAMPQYQKIVNRAKYAECMLLAGSIKTAEALYRSENNGVYRTGPEAILSNLAYVDLPARRRFSFSLKRNYMIYGYWNNDSANAITKDNANDAELGGVYRNNFWINLTDNTTGYSGDAPGSL